MGGRCCACSLTPILAVAGLLGLGAAGYRVAGGGCPFCHHDQAAATKLVSTSRSEPLQRCGNEPRDREQLEQTKLVGAEGKAACCAGMSTAECQEKVSECPAHGGCCDAKGEDKAGKGPEKIAASDK